MSWESIILYSSSHSDITTLYSDLQIHFPVRQILPVPVGFLSLQNWSKNHKTVYEIQLSQVSKSLKVELQ